LTESACIVYVENKSISISKCSSNGSAINQTTLVPLMVIVISEDVLPHTSIRMVQRNLAVVPSKLIPVTPEVEYYVVIVAVPDTTDHISVPFV
jgi:hypothetical protein